MLFLLVATVVTATPATLARVIATAPAGAEIRLQPGDYGTVTINRRRVPLRIDARQARMILAVRGSKGLSVIGGTFGPALGPGPAGYAAHVVNSEDVRFDNASFVDSQRGLVISQSSGVIVSNASLTGMRIDGINIASSQHVTIQDSRCADFQTGKAHPDCIQGWSRPATGITSDINILRNQSVGNMQGFFFGNHVRGTPPVDDGGFDRVAIIGNTVRGLYPQGVGLYSCRDCVVKDNRTERLPGARWRVATRVINCTRCKVSGNQEKR